MTISEEKDLIFHKDTGHIQWLNIYGLNYVSSFQKIIHENSLDDFLLNLIGESNHRTKLVELEKCFFLSIKSIIYSDLEQAEINLEQMMFVMSPHFVWSIQEQDGDYFDHIRARIRANRGIVRKKGSNYLLFLMLESIIDSYYNTKEQMTDRLFQTSHDFFFIAISYRDFFCTNFYI